jgi:hypothetical protein
MNGQMSRGRTFQLAGIERDRSIFSSTLGGSVMPKKSLIALFAVFAFLAGGCENLPFFGGGEDETVESVEAPSPAAGTPQTEPTSAAQQPATTPQQPSGAAASGLIASTDPKARQNNAQGRADPFSVFPTRVTVKPTGGGAGDGAGGGEAPPEVPGRSIPELPPLPPIPPVPRFGQPRGGSPGQGGTGNGQGAGQGAEVQGRSIPEVPPLPPIATPPRFVQPGAGAGAGEGASGPTAVAAQGVKVTGVIEVAGVPHAIVEAPGQKPRYVKAGDYLANGQVLVKRIETKSGSGPVVILEEQGIEVAKRVGEGGVAATDSGQEGGQINRVS